MAYVRLLSNKAARQSLILFISTINPRFSVFQNVLNWVSNLTRQAPQEAVGLTLSVTQNALGGVEKVKYFDGQQF
ncbi:hypothetical protein SAMN05192529_1354 [Arachidicoccus rhizosphaerae]|uniref:Uncharacterized protein n=1 Tax=Arachidicoccus rhizosphaerae TaxID=551991 RepID=A0A1H4CQR4_9BACT|nr:hypothetical protein SAMN05192529_1354 [Arachidicoccus rhizosphaerae]